MLQRSISVCLGQIKTVLQVLFVHRLLNVVRAITVKVTDLVHQHWGLGQAQLELANEIRAAADQVAVKVVVVVVAIPDIQDV